MGLAAEHVSHSLPHCMLCLMTGSSPDVGDDGALKEGGGEGEGEGERRQSCSQAQSPCKE